MIEREDEYLCSRCLEKWQFCPEDYDYDKSTYPTTCPLCNMPISQMIKDVFKQEGLMEVIKMLWIRISTK
mgnify:CR=1 FL=1